MKNTLLLFFLFLFCQVGSAKTNDVDTVTFCGYVYDAFTRGALTDGVKASITLLRPDSTKIRSTTSYDETEKGVRYTSYAFKVPKRDSYDYIVRVDAEGYESKVAQVSAKLRKGYPVVFSDAIYLRRRQDRQIDEVVVTATKIKFYNKGDTLVYNADAFQLQEGSMLDELIAQLPGAKLEKDGRIMVNGKFVESLMLNGRDFFKHDNTVLLDNLPAYMVNQIQVYEKDDEKNRDLNLGHKLGDGRLVMDVKLKRQYEVGWLTNAEGGYGSSDRYLGRLFATRYTRQSTIAVFGNINNVNDRRKPDNKGNMDDIDSSGSLTATKRVGMNYSVLDKYDGFDIKGNAELKYTNTGMDKKGTLVDFLPGGDVFNVSSQRAKDSNLEFLSNHNFLFRLKSINTSFSVSPFVEYRKTNSANDYINGSFGAMPYDDCDRTLDSLHSPMWAKTLTNIVRRNVEQSKGNSENTKLGSAFWTMYTFPNTQNALSLDFNVTYSHKRQDDFNRFAYDHYDAGQILTDSRNRYNRLPQTDLDLSAILKHIWTWNFYVNMQTSYSFSRKYSDGDQMRYRLDKLDEETDHPLGWTADAAALSSVLDADNSYGSTLHQYEHTFMVDWQWIKCKKDEQRRPLSCWMVGFKPSVTLEDGNYNFRSITQPQRVKRNYVLPNMEIVFSHHFVNSLHFINLRAKYNTYSPSLTDLVDKRFAYNPLDVTLGNPNLKKRGRTQIELKYVNIAKNQHSFNSVMTWTCDNNAIGTKLVYDKSSGAKTSQLMNVNGNWHYAMETTYWRVLDKLHRFSMNSYSVLQFYNRENYISTSGEMAPSRVGTKTLVAYQNLQFRYRYKKVSLQILGSIDYEHMASSREDFNSQNTFQFTYGGYIMLSLPWKMQFTSSLNMYSRRGYKSSSMNSNDLVWNARLSKTFARNRLVLTVDAWDILNNLSNVDIGSDSKSRWEYYTNVIPHYFMARLAYRFVRQPKKRK